jgi:hypothetical protein
MRRLDSEVIGSAFWIAVGVLFAVGAVGLNLGTFRRLGSGFFPMVMASILILFGLGTLIKGLMRPAKPLSPIPWKPHAVAIIAIIFYSLIIKFIGFLLSTFILMTLLFGLLIRGERKWAKVFLYSAVTALAAWLTFSVLLGVPFPSGRLMAIWR